MMAGPMLEQAARLTVAAAAGAIAAAAVAGAIARRLGLL